MTIFLPRKLPSVLGVGAFLKNTLCLIQGDRALLSPDNGALDSVAAVERFEAAAYEMIAMAEGKLVAVAHDLHPDFASTRFALKCGVKPVGVQHHHAHIAAVMAEHGIEEPVLGLALDGFGLGLDNEAWGGELLRVDADGFERLGHLYPLPQPGGDIAARQTWRMGAAALFALGRGAEIADRYKNFPNAPVLASMMERRLNCPMTTSCGRLFDAACGLLGVKPMAAFEGEAPMALEELVRKISVDPEGWRIVTELKQGTVLDMRPLLEKLAGREAQEGAELFHGTLIAALAEWVKMTAEKTGITSVALGGGCFFNKVLREGLCQRMIAGGLVPLLPRQTSFGDPAVSLGQAWATVLFLRNGAIL